MESLTERAFEYWYNLTPEGRYEIIRKVAGEQDTIREQFWDCINYIKNNILQKIEAADYITAA